MATLEAFEITQRKIGSMFDMLLDYMSDDFSIGVQNEWRVLVSSVLGSVDMIHFVSFPLAYPGSHPLHLDGRFDEGVEMGLINADLTAASKESHIFPLGEFDPDWATSPAGSIDYPAWDGYPVSNPLLPPYPVSGGRIPVFLRGMMIAVNSGNGSIAHDSTFDVVLPRPFAESSRDDMYDIRVYRFDSTSGDVPSLPLEEVNRTLDLGTDTVTIQVGNDPTQTIEEEEQTFYEIYWNSPDDFVAVTPPAPASGSDATASLRISVKKQRDLFDTNRYDLVDYLDTSSSHFMKCRNHTQLDIVDGSEEGYDTLDPEFYGLPALRGSLDPDYLTSDPSANMAIGNVWGYGYSLDSGTLDPVEEVAVYGVSLSLAVTVNGVTWVVRRGPEVYPEFWPTSWDAFAYHPEIGTNEILVAKAVVKRIASDKEAAYRPNSSVIHLEYVPSYGRQHSLDLGVLNSLVPIVLRNMTVADVVAEMADHMTFPLVTMTPPLSGLQGGMIYKMTSVLLGLQAAKKFNACWKNPLEDPEIKAAVDTLSEYMEEQLDSYPGQVEFDENLCSLMATYALFQPSRVLSSFNPDQSYASLDFGTSCHSDRKLAYPTGLEISLPKKRTCHRLIQLDRLQRDYSIKLLMRNQRLDTVSKEVFLSASTKWISDTKAATMLAAGQNRDPYLWPTKLAQNPTWVQYGRSVLIPDAVGGESHPLVMRPFDPRDTSLPLYEDFVAERRALGYTESQILDAVTDQEYLHGGFDTVDYETIPKEMVSIDEMKLGITMYNETGIPIWKNSSEVFGDDPRTRYGFKVADVWHYQDFDQLVCNQERGLYVETHLGLGDNAKSQSVEAGTPSTEFALDGSSFSLATTFTADFVSVSPKITKIRLRLKAVGLPLVKLAVSINGTGGGGSPGPIMQISDWVNYDAVPLELGWVEFSFPSPASLVAGARYAIVLYSDDSNPALILNSSNRIEWAYADRDVHSYGMTSLNSKLLRAVEIGESAVEVADASVFSSAPFYAVIDDELITVLQKVGNTLHLSSPLTEGHLKEVRMFEVTYVPSDTEKRWIFTNPTGAAFAWAAPNSHQSFDASYQMDVLVSQATKVEEVPTEEWSGTDVSPTLNTLDVIYIAASGDFYSIEEEGGMYGTLGGLSPLATFNGPSTFGFPSLNTFRASATNVVDGFVGWTTNRLPLQSTLSVFPSAKDVSGVVTYIPTEHDMYITAACVRWDGTVKVVDTLIPAGTEAPLLIDSEEFVGISLLWVEQNAFVSDSTYGFGAGETFVIRSR